MSPLANRIVVLAFAIMLIGRLPAADHVEAQVDSAISVETVAHGLEAPWEIAFAPDGRAFITERPGRVRVMVNGQLQDEPWATLNVAQHE